MTSETRAEIAELKASLATLEKDRAEEALRSERAPDLCSELGKNKMEIDYSNGNDSDCDTEEVLYTWDEIVQVLGPFIPNSPLLIYDPDVNPEADRNNRLSSALGRTVVERSAARHSDGFSD